MNTAEKKLEEAKAILQTESEINQGKSPSRLDAFIRTLEEDRDYYKSEAEKWQKMFRNTFSSRKRAHTRGTMSKSFSSIQGVSPRADVLKTLREREELRSTLKKYERHMAEIQGNLKVVTAERDKIVNLYEQAQEEVSQLRQKVIEGSRSSKSTAMAQAMLRHVEIERDAALSDFQRMATERDSLREQLKIFQESAFAEKAHLEQAVDDLEAAVQKLESERSEQISKVMLMETTVESLETKMKRLTKRALESETELSRQEAECASLRLLNEKTEQRLLEAEQSLTEEKYRMQLTQEKTLHLNEKIDKLSRQNGAQQEEICALKETIAQLDKEKASLQGTVEEGREKIADFQENLAVKDKIISDLKTLISELEHAAKKSTETVCVYEKDITSLHQQLQEINKKCVQAEKSRQSLAQENDKLQEHLSNAKQDNQVLYKELAMYQKELDEMKLTVQDSNTDIARLKGILKSKERENSDLLENYHKACEQREDWEAKWRQVEADCSSVRLALISAESENRRLKQSMESLETEVEQLHSKCKLPYSEIEQLRKKLENEKASVEDLKASLVSCRDKEFQSRIANQEKDIEIQLLKEQLSLAESKLTVQTQDFTQLRNRVAQLELELGNSKRQLETERSEREHAVKELRHKNCTISYQLSSTLKTSSEHHRFPNWSLDLSQDG